MILGEETDTSSDNKSDGTQSLHLPSSDNKLGGNETTECAIPGNSPSSSSIKPECEDDMSQEGETDTPSDNQPGGTQSLQDPSPNDKLDENDSVEYPSSVNRQTGNESDSTLPPYDNGSYNKVIRI